MLNLVKPEQKKKIIGEYRLRVIVASLTLLFAAEVIALILLVPSFVTSYTRIQILNSQTVALKVQNATEEVASLNVQLKTANDYLKILSPSSASTSTPSDVGAVLQKIIDARGNTLKINGFAYRTQDSQQQVNVQGVAASRQDLLDFTKRLRQLPQVVAVDLPVSDFTASQNINFSVTILANPT